MPDPSAWRIDKERYVATSFNGLGAAVDGGRWNSAGIRVIYASEHLAMAAQEKYVHLPKPVPARWRFVKFRIEFGTVRMQRLDPAKVPAGWQNSPPSALTQAIGDAWVQSGATAILAVPSVIIPEETNFLLNPAHPDFARITVSAPEPFVFDLRVAQLREPRP